tara:strand:- start:2189 stop:2692 length:504 start_codon:yes stop_codon:yes gene_type:complete
LESTSQYLFLASAVKDGEGFWAIGVRNNDENILADETILDCHRKELIGNESAKEILYAINLNLDNLVNGLEKSNFLIDRPLKGISFNIPLNIMENIFDFWIDIYKNKEAWETCLGLLKIRKRLPLSDLIKSGSLKGNSKKWALEIETLHKYEPNSLKNNNKNEPMWK